MCDFSVVLVVGLVSVFLVVVLTVEDVGVVLFGVVTGVSFSLEFVLELSSASLRFGITSIG